MFASDSNLHGTCHFQYNIEVVTPAGARRGGPHAVQGAVAADGGGRGAEGQHRGPGALQGGQAPPSPAVSHLQLQPTACRMTSLGSKRFPASWMLFLRAGAVSMVPLHARMRHMA